MEEYLNCRGAWRAPHGGTNTAGRRVHCRTRRPAPFRDRYGVDGVPILATARIIAVAMRMASTLPFRSTSVHSSGAWALPPGPPRPIVIAGTPRFMGTFESV